MLRFVVLLACFLAFIPPALAQEKVRKTETISTTLKILSCQLSGGKPVEIPVAITYTLAAANNDGTLNGNLIFAWTEKERKKIAEATGKSLSDIPVNLTTQNVTAKLEKNTHCPEIRLEFTEMDCDIAGTKLHLNRFVLSLRETPQKLARALCIWTDRANKGVNNNGVVQYINLLLKGDEDDEPPK